MKPEGPMITRRTDMTRDTTVVKFVATVVRSY